MSVRSWTSNAEDRQDPRWHNRRREVIQSAGCQCQSCDKRNQAFDVHHHFYSKHRRIWEYSDKELSCWCRTCHDVYEEEVRPVEGSVFSRLPMPASWLLASAIHYGLVNSGITKNGTKSNPKSTMLQLLSCARKAIEKGKFDKGWAGGRS